MTSFNPKNIYFIVLFRRISGIFLQATSSDKGPGDCEGGEVPLGLWNHGGCTEFTHIWDHRMGVFNIRGLGLFYIHIAYLYLFLLSLSIYIYTYISIYSVVLRFIWLSSKINTLKITLRCWVVYDIVMKQNEGEYTIHEAVLQGSLIWPGTFGYPWG